MDIQTKITFIIRNVYRVGGEVRVGQPKPLEKEVTIVNNKIIKLDDIEFDEYKQVLVKIKSDDEYAYIEIDSSEDIESRKIIKNGNNAEEINPGGSSETMLVPGIYGFKVYIQNRQKELSYRITPSSKVGWEGLLNLRTYVENMATGLSYNFYKEKMSLDSQEDYEDPNVFARYSNIIDNIDIILNSMNNIIRNPLEELKKEYKEKKYSNRADSKSQRWITTKGLYKNTSLINQRFFYEKDVTLTINTIENQWFKKIVKSIIQELSEIKILLCEQTYIIEKSRDNKEEELNSKKKEWDKIKNKRNTLKSYKQEAKYKVFKLQKDLNSINEKQMQLNKYINNLEKHRMKLATIINNTWIKDIDEIKHMKKPTLKFLKDFRYNHLMNIYNKLNSNTNDESGDIAIKYTNKLTSTLFEYYVLIHVMKIINNKGYQWPNELINKDFNYISEMEDSHKDIALKFESKSYDIYISYDNIIRNTGKGFTIGSANHTRPDIRIDLYEKNGNIKKSMIIEIKCREGNCVYRDNRVEKQLRDYRYGFIYGEDEKNVVEQVIMVCLLTDRFKEVFEIKSKSIIGLPLEIKNEKDIPKGYESLKNQIKEFLKVN